nr:ribonuclease H-like domain-containing protein [Tanacetum cinerariifolium]
MRPFGYPVTILNTKDHLGKFNGKADEGFFVGYSLNSKAFRVFNSRTRIVEENLHIRFSENTPNIAGRSQSNGNAGTKACDDPKKEDNVNITKNVNTVGTNGVNSVGANTNNELPFDPEMHALEDIIIITFLSDHKDDDEEADMNNMDITIQVSPTSTTRIHKDHPLDQVIGDLHSTT